MQKNIEVGFAGMNSCHGFVGFYDEIINESKLTSLYVIKGGPGTGKSSFMRNVANNSAKHGWDAELYYCGSDADSLDCVIVKNGDCSIAILDGTPPHPYDYTAPGAAGEIIDTGRFWSRDKLVKKRDEISKLSADKKRAYDTAYRYIGASAKVNSHIVLMEREAYLEEKAFRACEKIVQSVGRGGGVRHRQLTAITMKGRKMLVPKSCTAVWSLDGTDCRAHIFLADVLRTCISLGVAAEYSLDPISGTECDAVYFREAGILLRCGEGDKKINLRRFFDTDKSRETRGRRRFGVRCKESLIEGALDALDDAASSHFKLEEIYGGAMDFDSLGKFTKEFSSSLLG